jgi:hypothetical protein
MPITIGEYTIINYNDINISYSEPSDKKLNMIWLDISQQPPLFYRWNGEEWEPCIFLSLWELDPEVAEKIDEQEAVISQIETSLIQHEESINAKVEQTDFDELNDIVNQQKTEIEQTATDLSVYITNTDETIGEVTGELKEITKRFRFDAEGLHIGESENPLQMTLSNEQLSFIDNGFLVAYVNGQKLFITMAEILESIVVGNHKIEKYDDEITLVRWVG